MSSEATEPKRLHILMVDDEPSFLMPWRGYLSSKGFRIETAATIQDALRSASERAFDLVITDLVFSSEDQSGVDLIRALKLTNPNLPIVVLSGYAGRFADELGALGVPVLSKAQIGGHALREAIDRALTASAERRRRGPRETTIQKEADALRLEDIRRVFADEAAKLVQLKERTLSIPGQLQCELPKALAGFKKDIERQILRFPFDENVFLMMKFRPTNREITSYIQETLQRKSFRGVRADDREWNITGNVYNPIAVLYCCRYGIALFDEPEAENAYSPNVAYELGIMHQQNKECLILKHVALPRVPFDLIKDLHVPYERDLQVRALIDRWLDDLAVRDDSTGPLAG